MMFLIGKKLLIINHNSYEQIADIEEMPNYRDQYRTLKRKLKFLIYENECFQEALRSTQRKLLKANRDKSYILDRLLYFEKVDASLSECDDETDSSDNDRIKEDNCKRKKAEIGTAGQVCLYSTIIGKSHSSRKKKSMLKTIKAVSTISLNRTTTKSYSLISDGHMTPEEVERHLESRQSYLELVPEKAPPTVPTEMFSNDASQEKLE